MNLPQAQIANNRNGAGHPRSRTGNISNGGQSTSHSKKRKMSDPNIRFKGVNSNNQTVMSVNGSD
jgi:hypothetical protein